MVTKLCLISGGSKLQELINWLRVNQQVNSMKT